MSENIALERSYSISINGDFKFSEIYDGIKSDVSLDSDNWKLLSGAMKHHENVKDVYDVIEEPDEIQDSHKDLYKSKKDYAGMIKHVKQGDFITLDILKTLVTEITKKGQKGVMSETENKKTALHVLNFFGYSDRIIDNILEPEDRDLFYMLEDSDILTTEREEVTLYDGREWRINYWVFRREGILNLINNINKKQKIINKKTASVYDELPENMWDRS